MARGSSRVDEWTVPPGPHTAWMVLSGVLGLGCIVALLLTRNPWWALGIAAAVAGVAVVGTLLLRAGGRAQRLVISEHVRRHGVDTVGHVVKIRVKAGEDLRSRWTVWIDFHDRKGRLCHAVRRYPYTADRIPKVREAWNVRYDPSHPERASHVVVLGPADDAAGREQA